MTAFHTHTKKKSNLFHCGLHKIVTFPLNFIVSGEGNDVCVNNSYLEADNTALTVLIFIYVGLK